MIIRDSDRKAIERFLARKQYDRAIELLEKLHKQYPDEMALKQKLADAYSLYSHPEKAVPLLEEVAETYARKGFVTKAMAVQKKIHRINPDIKVDLYEYMQEGEPEPAAEPPIDTTQRRQVVVPPKKSSFEILDKLFSGLSKDEFEDIFKLIEEQLAAPKNKIVEEGQDSDAMYIIMVGSVRVWTRHKNKEVELAVLKEGNFFGEVGLLTGNKRTANIAAVDECQLLRLSRTNFLKICQRYPNFRKTLESAMEKRAYSTIESLLSSEQN